MVWCHGPIFYAYFWKTLSALSYSSFDNKIAELLLQDFPCKVIFEEKKLQKKVIHYWSRLYLTVLALSLNLLWKTKSSVEWISSLIDGFCIINDVSNKN